MKRAVVLQGGGSKGAYEIGVWKALRKLHIKYDIVCGTSIGSLNGALMVQNNFAMALNMWKNIDYSFVFNKDYKNEFEIIKSRLVTKGGIDVTNFEKLIDKYLYKKRFYNSPIDFGLVTVNLKNLKPLFLIKKDIPADKLKDYLRASCNLYPVFPKKDIDGESYIDGGFRDVLPINLAIDMGADEVIAVALDSFGITPKVKNKNIKIIKIKPKVNLGPTLNFDQTLIKRNINLGYNDAMKTFHKLEGNIYTFKNKSLHKNFFRYKNLFLSNLKIILGNEHDIIENLNKIINYRIFFKEDEQQMETKFNQLIEYLGKTIILENDLIYDIRMFNKLLLVSYNENITKLDETNNNLLKETLMKMSKRNVIDYIYDNIKYEYKKTQLQILMLSVFFPQEFLSAIYLLTIDNDVFYE